MGCHEIEVACNIEPTCGGQLPWKVSWAHSTLGISEKKQLLYEPTELLALFVSVDNLAYPDSQDTLPWDGSSPSIFFSMLRHAHFNV